jgi:hypothetical protein
MRKHLQDLTMSKTGLSTITIRCADSKGKQVGWLRIDKGQLVWAKKLPHLRLQSKRKAIYLSDLFKTDLAPTKEKTRRSKRLRVLQSTNEDVLRRKKRTYSRVIADMPYEVRIKQPRRKK